MLENIIENEDYKNLIEKQISEITSFLFTNNQEFSIVANLKGIEFIPELPKSIKSKMSMLSLFDLKNYTYSTLKIDDEYLSFEAAFGADNYVSTLKVSLCSVLQIIIDESIIYLNPLATVEKFHNDVAKKSINVFKNNPNNKKFNS